MGSFEKGVHLEGWWSHSGDWGTEYEEIKMKLLKGIPLLLASLQLLSPGLCDKLEDNDYEDYEDFGEVETLSKEGITKTLSSAYDELSDLTDQLQNALDQTIKEADEYLASKSKDEYLPPKKKDEYIPPKKKDEYIPPKKKEKVKERPYLPPTRRPETGYVSPDKDDTDDTEPPEVESSYNLPPPPPGYDKYLQSLNSIENDLKSLQDDHTIVTTYTVPPGSPLPDNHILVPPELLQFPSDSEFAKPLEEDAEEVFIVDSYIPKEEERIPKEVEFERQEEETTEPSPAINILKYIPLFIVTTIAMAASIVFGNVIG